MCSVVHCWHAAGMEHTYGDGYLSSLLFGQSKQFGGIYRLPCHFDSMKSQPPLCINRAFKKQRATQKGHRVARRKQCATRKTRVKSSMQHSTQEAATARKKRHAAWEEHERSSAQHDSHVQQRKRRLWHTAIVCNILIWQYHSHQRS